MNQDNETRYRFEGKDLLKEAASDKRFFLRLKLKKEDGSEVIEYEPTTLGKVWVSGGPDKFYIHAEVKRLNDIHVREWRYNISESEYKDFQMNKHSRKRLQLLTKASGGLIVVRKNKASKFVGIRMTEELYEKLSVNAKKCNMSLSDYCREQLAGNKTYAALTDEETKMLDELSKWRLDFLNFRNALIGVLKRIPQEERLGYMINGESAKTWRDHLKQALLFIDDFLEKRRGR